jgi:hypothetical protein
MLIVHAFPQYEKLPQHRLDLLFKLTENLNILTQQFIIHGSFIKCLHSEHKIDSPDSCKCLEALLSSLVTLHAIILEHRNFNFNKYKFRIKSAVRSLTMSMGVLLWQARKSNDFEDCAFVLNKLNFIYTSIKYDKVFDESCGRRIKTFDFYFDDDESSTEAEITLKKNLETFNLEEKTHQREIDPTKEELINKLYDLNLRRALNFKF